MSDTKHTPGEWCYHAETERVFNELWCAPRQQTRYQVYSARGKFAHIAECENEADARLIAAAPDLLAACKALVASAHPRHMRAAWNEGHAAIAKAEGKSP